MQRHHLPDEASGEYRSVEKEDAQYPLKYEERLIGYNNIRATDRQKDCWPKTVSMLVQVSIPLNLVRLHS